MSVPRKVTTWVCIIGALMMLAWPDMADAQRRGIRRRARPVLHTRIWYGPGFYGPYAYGPYSYGQWGPWGPYPYYGRYDVRGSVRIEVKPEETEVYVDGYYVGVVDSYDGVFQRLHLPPGPHDIELRLEGHHSLQEQMYLPVGSTYHIKHRMEPLGPGETTPPPPVPSAPPEPQEPPEVAQPDPEATAPPRQRSGARRAPPRLRVPVGDFGTLSIRVQPEDAVILVDGEEWRGPASGRLELDLGAGRHRIDVRRDGYESYVTDVEVRPGDTTGVNISLPRNERGR